MEMNQDWMLTVDLCLVNDHAIVIRRLQFNEWIYELLSWCWKAGQHHDDDPRMSSIATYATIIRNLVLPCYKQISDIIVSDDDDNDDTNNNNKSRKGNNTNTNTVLITTNNFARQVCILLSKQYNIPLIILNLQPTIPNHKYPNYRVSIPKFVNAVIVQFRLSTSNSHEKRNQQHPHRWDQPPLPSFPRIYPNAGTAALICCPSE